jgi:formylglycine-generating enzyme required for sulfatase activity
MDVFPVTNADYYSFYKRVNIAPWIRRILQHWENGKPTKEDANKPVTYISYEDALAYANFYGKDLPTESQWQYAAQTASGNEWPWQQTRPVIRKRTTIDLETLDEIIIAGLDSTQVNTGNGIAGYYRQVSERCQSFWITRSGWICLAVNERSVLFRQLSVSDTERRQLL